MLKKSADFVCNLEKNKMQKVLDILLGLCYHVISGGLNLAAKILRPFAQGCAQKFLGATWRAAAELVKTEFGGGWILSCKNGFWPGLAGTL